MNLITRIATALDPSPIAADFQSAADDALGVWLLVLPIGLGLLAVLWGVPRAVRFFKSLAR